MHLRGFWQGKLGLNCERCPFSSVGKGLESFALIKEHLFHSHQRLYNPKTRHWIAATTANYNRIQDRP